MPPSISAVLRLPVAIPAQISRDLSTVADAVTRLPALIAGLDARLRFLSEDVAALRETAATLQVHVATMGAELSDLGRTVKQADRRVERLGVAVDELALRVAHVDDGLDDRVPSLQSVPGDVERITRDIARVLELTPDPDEPGAFEKVREALTPGS